MPSIPPMPKDEVAKPVAAGVIAMVYVDGVEVARAHEGEDYNDLYRKTKEAHNDGKQHEYALMVYNTMYGWLRRKLEYCA